VAARLKDRLGQREDRDCPNQQQDKDRSNRQDEVNEEGSGLEELGEEESGQSNDSRFVSSDRVGKRPQHDEQTSIAKQPGMFYPQHRKKSLCAKLYVVTYRLYGLLFRRLMKVLRAPVLT